MNKKVEIFTKPYCAYCQRAKELLRIKGVQFIEHDITKDPLKAAEMLHHSIRERLPGIFINDSHIGDCAELFALDEVGKLDALLGLTANGYESCPSE